MDHVQRLRIIARAWGRQQGYCFFPYMSGTAEDQRERIQSYTQGPAFRWPADQDKIIEHMKAHEGDDLYWCPSLFEEPLRQLEYAMDEYALWADLDRVDPRTLDEYPPTIAWETSPNKYQALWIINGMMQGASWPGRENQCLTYYIGADHSGWDTTQLLRIPEWHNHKPEYRSKNGEAPLGKLLWKDRRIYLQDDFNDLPDVPSAEIVSEILQDEIDRVDRHAVWGRVRLQVSKRVREFVGAREMSGDRSEVLWQIERELADAGCSIVEIVAIVRHTVWNKYDGRSDELRRLTTEASKAVALKKDSQPPDAELEASERPNPQRLFLLLKDLKPPTWLVKNVITRGACGFIAGQPKSFKSWVGLDLALSVATGTPFLGYYDVVAPGPVLYIQEEDAPTTVKKRLDKVWPDKHRDRMIVEHNGHGPQLMWIPAKDNREDPPIDGYISQGFTVSDPGWQSWLDEMLSVNGYQLVIMDPLMMIAGDVDEYRAQDMTEKVFKPLKQLARKHDTAMYLVHHMKKGDPKTFTRGGQLLLGSVANHAWAEDSMFVRPGKRGTIIVEQESKNAPVPGFQVTNLYNSRWEPVVIPNKDGDDDSESEEGRVLVSNGQRPRSKTANQSFKEQGYQPSRRDPLRGKVAQTLQQFNKNSFTTAEMAKAANLGGSSTSRQLTRLAEQGKITRQGTGRWGIK